MPKDSRVHLRIPEDMKDWAMGYAKARNLTLSSLILQLLVQLQDSERAAQQPQEAEQV